MRAQYDRLKEQGVCTQCGTRPAREDAIRCQHCTDKRAKRRQQQKRQWDHDGVCTQCGRERQPGYKLCSRCLAKSRKSRAKHREKNRRMARERYHRVKQKAFEAYGGSVCACCGETEEMFLTLDHINNDGAEHRRMLNDNLVEWLGRHNFPPGFQVLCMNCNWGKYINHGVCPHKAE